MKAKRVRFKDSETEPNHLASCRLGDSSAACEARENPPNEKLKQDVGRSCCQNPQNRKSLPVSNAGPNNHSRAVGDSKIKDVKSSLSVKKPTTGEIGSFLSPKDAALESSATPMPEREHDTGWFKSSSLVKTPCISLDSFLSTTANGSVKTESQQSDGDIFSSKRQKLLQQIAKTLFLDADEVPKECNLVLLLLRRLIPESSQETLSQNKQLRQPETKEKCQLHLGSNIQHKEALNTKKLRKANDDHFLDSYVPAAQSRRVLEPPPTCQTLEGNDASAASFSYRKLGHKEGNGEGSSPYGVGYGCWSNRFEDRNQLTLGNELCDYSTAGSNSSNIFKNEAYEQFPYDAHDSSWSCRTRDPGHSYEFLDRSYNSFAAAKSSSLVYKDEIHDFDMDRGAQSSPDTWCGSSHVYLERFRPFASSNLRDYTEPNCLNGFEIRTEPCRRLIGWNTDESNVHDSTQSTNMEIEIYHPPSITCTKYLQDNPELETHDLQSTWSGNHLVSLEKRNMLHSSPYTYHDHDTQEQHLQRNDLVPTSPCIPLKLLFGPEQLNPNDSALSISGGSSFFYIPQNGSWSICERNCPVREAFSWPESDYGLKCKSTTGSLNEQYDACTDDSAELFSPEHSKSQFLIADENDHSIPHQERRSMTSVHVPLDQEDLYPLQLHTLMWKDTEDQTCDYDRGTTSTSDSLFW